MADFDVIETGIEGKVQVVPARDAASTESVPFTIPRKTLPFGLPPVLKSLEENLEEVLTSLEKLPIHNNFKYQRFIPRTSRPERLYSLDVSPVPTTIVVNRNPTTGELIGFTEEFIQDCGSSSKNSTSLRRPPGPPEESVKGSSTNFPFWPGGLDEPDIASLSSCTKEEKIDLENDLLQVPPGFSHGVSTFSNKPLSKILDLKEQTSVIDLRDLLAADDLISLEDKGDHEKPEVEKETNTVVDVDPQQKNALDEIIKLDERIEPPGEDYQLSKQDNDEQYAIKVDTNSPVDDFHEKIPNMAYKWPFELDVFQKQAILKLENHENVFVAAHTSAGKTVVAEYAIALSLKHMTRTIYTSPIKALSNQKFRDFKTTFEDVGLITGDVQINPQAACLIMTTEILRSMLYGGSDVIRDLEWVIFDEVHYINDVERGVVWEEVLIMLPQHVSIILLSATVPNSMEFADWVGRTKRKKVYVVSTQKRPVPLEHYLYTGNSSKTSNELFLLIDANKNFLTQGYNKAVEAKKERPVKPTQAYGAKGQRAITTSNQDKNVWLSVIEMLRKKDKLPVVAFTFSKKKIEENAQHTKSVDLLTASEKSEVHIFFQKSISRLKGGDRKLPQVLHMIDLLKRGFGVHHSGVLPILKEVIEMLFQKGLVKVLFATETFAMGVNMPARTVVFDSIRKHDGTNFRDLLPGEYVQMAGRAGRRGKDKTGTVIILCKGDVPQMADLHHMMLGKPMLLQSQFRLTYTMILNLLRVEQLRVEDMMKRSFSEFHTQKDQSKHKEALETLLKKMSNMPEVIDYSGDLEQYYRACEEYTNLRHKLQAVIISHPQAVKMLVAGRVVIIDTKEHEFTLAIILQTSSSSSKHRTFTGLILCEQKQDAELDSTQRSRDVDSAAQTFQEDDWPVIKPFRTNQLYRPEGPCPGCELIKLGSSDISVITTKTIKVNADRIIDDIKKRQQPRFRNDPPGQSTSVACQELLRLTEANPMGLPGLDPVKDLHIRDVEMVEEFRRLSFLEESLPKYNCIHHPNFEQNFEQLRANMKLTDQYNKMKFLLSDQSLQLLPEYQQRIQVLRQLEYIDSTNTVQLKGRVACEISSQELIITELVFHNVLTELHPTEIAATLSCVVFEQKRCSEPNLSPCLKKCKDEFLKIAEDIGVLQRQCGLLIPVEEYVEQFHFGLMEVVFEWARGMPFAEITELTDVQEGIIVRCIQRLDETLKDVRNAARIIGDPILYQKMEEASTMIKRDIVFAASLYTQ